MNSYFHQSPFKVSRMIFNAGLALTVIFVSSVVTQVLPVRLLEPQWQYRLASSLIDNGTMALLGLILVLLAGSIDSERKAVRPGTEALLEVNRFHNRVNAVRNLARLAAIGYLMLLPLLAFSVWRGYGMLKKENSMRRDQTSQTLKQIVKVVEASKSTDELVARMTAINAPPIPPQLLERPLPQLKSELITQVNSSSYRLVNQFANPSTEQVLSVVQVNLRKIVTSLMLSIGFGFSFRTPFEVFAPIRPTVSRSSSSTRMSRTEA